MERYFTGLGRGVRRLASTSSWRLGHFPASRADAPFNMAVMGLRLAGLSNGVSKLHGDVSREMFQAPVARRARRGGADRLDHQRRARPDLGVAGDERPADPVRPAGLGRGR